MDSQKFNIVYLLGVALVLSLFCNIYLIIKNKEEGRQTDAVISTSTSNSLAIKSPYGYRSEVVTVLDNGELKTYSTTTAITAKDAEQMQKQMKERIRAIEKYFAEQERFFRSFWGNFGLAPFY